MPGLKVVNTMFLFLLLLSSRRWWIRVNWVVTFLSVPAYYLIFGSTIVDQASTGLLKTKTKHYELCNFETIAWYVLRSETLRFGNLLLEYKNQRLCPNLLKIKIRHLIRPRIQVKSATTYR